MLGITKKCFKIRKRSRENVHKNFGTIDKAGWLQMRFNSLIIYISVRV
jgi:hypothetical protein